MRTTALLILLSALTLASCGTAVKAPSTQEEELLDAGYGKVRSSHNTNSISKIKNDDKVTYTDMYEYIRGKCPGVLVRGQSIQIRGISSINSSTEPLILLDGIEHPDLSDINPSNVESVSVLKDSAASIYGSRGANGVILIKTKSAK